MCVVRCQDRPQRISRGADGAPLGVQIEPRHSDARGNSAGGEIGKLDRATVAAGSSSILRRPDREPGRACRAVSAFKGSPSSATSRNARCCPSRPMLTATLAGRGSFLTALVSSRKTDEEVIGADRKRAGQETRPRGATPPPAVLVCALS